MITHAKFRNFKALRDVEVTFDSRLTVLVGPNGSGKTSLLQGADCLCRGAESTIPGRRPFEVKSAASDLTVSADMHDFLMEVEGRNRDGHEIGFRVCPPPPKPDGSAGGQEPGLIGYAFDATAGSEWVQKANPPAVVEPFAGSAFLRFNTTALAAPSTPNGIPPRVEESGAGLASTLAYAALNQPDQFTAIVTAFRKVIRNVQRVRFDRVQSSGYSDVILFDMAGAPGVAASKVSTGTLQTLGLLTVILGPQQPRVLLLDDIDNGLHPSAQTKLVDVLRSILDDHPDVQVIATSHSPYILDRLEWNEVRVMTQRDDGSAVCRPLDAHPDFERWKEAMSPGEFWGTFYEDWLTRKPSPQPVP